MKKYQVVARLDMRKICKYRKKLWTMEVILTAERREHIKRDHGEVFNVIIKNLRNTIEDVDLIYEDRKHKWTLYFIKRIDKNYQNVVIRLAVRHKDRKQVLNSVITSWILSENYLNKIAKKNDLVYTRDSEK